MALPTLDDFFARRRSAALPLVSDDAVRVIAGPKQGAVAAVLLLEDSEPELTFQIEFSDGTLAIAPISHLRLLRSDEPSA